MIQEWRAFLLEAGAVLDSDQVQHFGQPREELAALISDTIMTDLSPFGLIAVKGEDANTFLQNFLANDVREVNINHSQLTGLCNPKGRLLALFRLFQRGADSYLSLPQSLLEVTLKRLNMYVLRSSITLMDASNQLCQLGLAGTGAEEELKRVFGTVPETINSVCQTTECSILRVPGEPPRFEVVGEPKIMQQTWQELSHAAIPTGSNLWKLLNIRAGIPTIYPETQETFIPQQVNLEFLKGISFTKGCYPGQEVIARLHYRGKPSRRMFLAHIATPCPPQPGDPLYLAKDKEERAVGEVVDAQQTPEGGCDSLVVLQLASLEKGDITLGRKRAQSPKFLLRELPYQLSPTPS